MREPEIAYASARIRPFPLASGPAGCPRKMNSPNPNSPEQKEKTEQRNEKKAPLKFTIAQIIHKFHLFIYTAIWPRY
jgi:hypothetical protein